MLVDGLEEGAHRISWKLHGGTIPNGMLVCHRCDVPACVRPDHLFVGTQSDNLRDAFRKGRLPHLGKYRCPGEKNGFSKLTEADVRLIRKMASVGMNYGIIARHFGVDRTNIGYVVRRCTWRHVP